MSSGTARPLRAGGRLAPARVCLSALVLLAVWLPRATAPVEPAAAAALAQAPRTTPLAYGFQGDFFQPASRPRAIGAVRDAGFGWAKQQVRWSDYEVQAPDCAAAADDCLAYSIGGRTRYFRRQQLEFLDAVVDDLSGARLSVLLSVVHAPAFAAAPGGHSPADPRDLGDFVFFLASRYAGKVKAIEPWNEQNLSWEWGGDRLWPNAPSAPPQGVTDFVALQKAAYQSIKAADARITVVLPALTPTGLGDCWLTPAARSEGFCLDQVRTAIDDRLYLDFVFQVNGGEIKNFYDVLGVHPSGYNNAPDDWVDTQTVPTAGFKGHGSFYIKRYQQLRDVQLKHGDAKPMWFTEVGWSVAPHPAPGYEYARDNTEDARGVYVARLLEQVHREAPYVSHVFLWNLNFRTLVPGTDEKYGFGMIDPDGSRTPAYRCAADFVTSGNRISRAECRAAPAAGATLPAHTPAPAATGTSTAVAPAALPTPTPTAPAPATPTELPTATRAPTPHTAAPAATPTPAERPITSPPSIVATVATVATGATQALTPDTSSPATTPTIPAAASTAATATALPAPTPAPQTHAPSPTPPAPADSVSAPAGQLPPTQPAVVDPAGARASGSGPDGPLGYTVVKGDTLFSIAHRSGTSVDALVAANGLPSRDAVLPIGRTLSLPTSGAPAPIPAPPVGGGHTVAKGDTLFSIARRTNTSVDALVAANGLGSRDAVLAVGRTLVVPTPSAPPAGAPTPPAPPLPVSGGHTVAKGDTLFSIARRTNTSVDALVAANGLGSRDAVLAVGRTLVIP